MFTIQVNLCVPRSWTGALRLRNDLHRGDEWSRSLPGRPRQAGRRGARGVRSLGYVRTSRRGWHSSCAGDNSGKTPSSPGPEENAPKDVDTEPIVLRLGRCRRCGELFEERLNHKRACRFHGHPLGDRGYYRLFMVPREEAEASLTWPEYGRDTGSASRWVLQYRWSCCGSTHPDSLGCRLDRHLSWDAELKSYEGVLNDAQLAAWKLRSQWG